MDASPASLASFSSPRFPLPHRCFRPLRVFLRMTQQAGIRALFLTKLQRQVRVRNAVNLVGAGAHQHRIHNFRHVAPNAAAAF